MFFGLVFKQLAQKKFLKKQITKKKKQEEGR